MQIEHLAIYTHQLAQMRQFYIDWFNAASNEKYHNPTKKFSSYFLQFESGARLELMEKESVAANLNNPAIEHTGLTHFAFRLPSRQAVDELCARMKAANIPVLDGPRQTGDGYYEFLLQDPDGNRIEVTA
jgi:lactoylglutathione lyase